MRKSFALILLVLVVWLMAGACAETKNVRVDPRQGFSEAPMHDGDYWKKAALGLKLSAQNAFGRQAEDLFFQTLIDSIDHRVDRLRLLSPHDAQFPDFMKAANPFSDPQATFDLHKKARLAGFNCLMQATVLDIRPEEKKEGFWWFRGTKYYLNVLVALDIYDTFTAAKVSSQVMEELVKISPAAYENYQTGMPDSIAAVDDALVEMARDMGKQAAEQLTAGHWMAAVAQVQGRQVRLAAGANAGLAVGNRLAVFEGRRIVDGLGGEKFIVPGYKVADIQIVTVEADGATATTDNPADIQPGDIAIPAE